ncbi:penicillin acylase family protein [Pseudarthrobacter sp. NamE2]|uniref:penicillin acylase family protein n=1 Tax=Pseudarthrobacter sp. NamE2 TaxID=2576838 RepID=UPI0010FD5AAC|nr:penicillin acylase family protein [Pseudarthrobacter sp. NamE2]TLM82706.1 penicillin acylase family protein [Pseudarthrobacter sp. NamE2]
MPAETFRDPWGIPHLRADSVHELAFLQGHNAASDRSWQIEMERWRSEGRTAGQLGREGLLWDRFARQARIDDTAQRCFDNLDAETQQWVSAYVDGVNAALADGRRGAQEFRDTDTEPAAWQPWTPLGVFLVNHILFSTFPNKLWRDHVAHTLGPEAVELFSIEAPVWSGSNAWAVAGSLTSTGRPLVAGDPHRLLELPGVYQQVRLACPEFDVVGLAFPGVPGLPHFGHAGDAAWAVTNAMADYQDLYREQLQRDGSTLQALGPNGWEPVLAEHDDEILVRGAGPERVPVIETARGPVVTSGYDGGTLSLRTPSRVSGRLGFEALLPLLRSRTAADVQAAFSAWVEPVNCVLAADSAGDVRQLVAGAVPDRNTENRVRPVPAESPGHQWTGGWVKLPAGFVKTMAVNANDRDSGGGDLTGLEFAPAHRANRIRHLLEEAGSGLDADAMQRIHMDSSLGPWPAFRAVLEGCGNQERSLSAAALDLRNSLLAWDGDMAADSAKAGAFSAWRSAFVQALATAPLLAPLARPAGHSPLFSPWLNPVSRVGSALDTIVAKGDKAGLDVAAAAAEALEVAAASPSSDSWGNSHTVLPLHALADYPQTGAAVPAVPRTALSGDTNCVLSTESLPGITDASFRGPVARYVWDLSDRSKSRWIVPFGASGDPGDQDFLSQLPLWAAGELLPVVTDWDRLTKENP